MFYAIDGAFYAQGVTGIQRYAREIVAALDEIVDRGVVELVVPLGVQVPEMNRIDVVRVGSGGGIRWEQGAFSRYLRERGRIGLCLCNTLPLNHSGDIVVIHDISYKVNPRFFRGLRNRMSAAWHRLNYHHAVRTASTIVTVSEFSKCEIARVYDVSPGRILVCPNAWQHFASVPSDEGALGKFGVSEGSYFFSLSSVAPNKNVAWILACARLMPETRFLVAGKITSGGVVSDVPDNVSLIGYVSDAEAKSLMSHCRAFLFPTLYEGFGIPPLEALSAGADIVVSDTPCMREVYGGAATYIDPRHPAPIVVEDIPDSVKKGILGKYGWDKSASILRMLICSQ